jgi:hypothetical protein
MMMIKRGRSQENPRQCLGLIARWSERDLVRGLHQGQRSVVPHKQAGHMTAPRNDQNKHQIALAPKEPSTHDTASASVPSTFMLQALLGR